MKYDIVRRPRGSKIDPSKLRIIGPGPTQVLGRELCRSELDREDLIILILNRKNTIKLFVPATKCYKRWAKYRPICANCSHVLSKTDSVGRFEIC